MSYDGKAPPMPRSRAEWEMHWAFYQIAIFQRNSAWREIEEMEKLHARPNQKAH